MARIEVALGTVEEQPAPDASGRTPGYAEKLTEIANELQGLSGHIKEYLTGEMTTLPLLWDIQEVVINFERVIRPDELQCQ